MYLSDAKFPVLEFPLAKGNQGTRETMQFMRALIREGRKHPSVRSQALSLVGHFPQKAYAKEIRAVFNFVQNNIRYVRDTRGVELLHQPDKLLEIGQGDCDDKSILLCSMLEAIGHPTRLEAIAHTNPKSFGHVFCSTKLGNKWLPLDATEPHRPGWHPQRAVKRYIMNV